jgi:hypothetical protein
MSCQFHVKDGFKAPKNWVDIMARIQPSGIPTTIANELARRFRFMLFRTLSWVGKSQKASRVLFSASPSWAPGWLLRSNPPIFRGMPLGC